MAHSHLSLALFNKERGPERDCKELRLGDRGFGFFDDRGERGRVENCQLGQALAIEFDAGLGAAVDELAVAEAVLAAGRVDADDPQLAELALAYAAIAEGEGFGANDVFLGAYGSDGDGRRRNPSSSGRDDSFCVCGGPHLWFALKEPFTSSLRPRPPRRERGGSYLCPAGLW